MALLLLLSVLGTEYGVDHTLSPSTDNGKGKSESTLEAMNDIASVRSRIIEQFVSLPASPRVATGENYSVTLRHPGTGHGNGSIGFYLPGIRKNIITVITQSSIPLQEGSRPIDYYVYALRKIII